MFDWLAVAVCVTATEQRDDVPVASWKSVSVSLYLLKRSRNSYSWIWNYSRYSNVCKWGFLLMWISLTPTISGCDAISNACTDTVCDAWWKILSFPRNSQFIWLCKMVHRCVFFAPRLPLIWLKDNRSRCSHCKAISVHFSDVILRTNGKKSSKYLLQWKCCTVSSLYCAT